MSYGNCFIYNRIDDNNNAAASLQLTNLIDDFPQLKSYQ